MDRLTKFSLKNRAAVIIMVFLISVLGVYSGSKLPMEFYQASIIQQSLSQPYLKDSMLKR